MEILELIEARRRERMLPPPEVGKRICRNAGLSAGDVGDVLHVSRQAVDNWWRGKRRPRGRLAVDYVNLLGILTAAEK